MKILESHIVPAISEKIRLQEYAVSIFTSIQTRSGLKKAIKKGEIILDGEKAQTGDWIKPGQKIEVLKLSSENKKIFKLDIEVLFEDDHIAVVHKPPGYPTSGNFFKTIENALPYNLAKSSEFDALPYPLPAHRLDNPTSGILLCAKTRSSLIKLQEAFAKKEVEKSYFAIIHGTVEKKLKLDSEIDKKPSISIVKPIELYHINSNRFSLVELNPLTGRTHQLRIHLSKNQTPIIGDPLYGNEENEYFNGKNLYLFAAKISFEHPVLENRLEYQLKLPKKFRNLDYYRVH